MDRASLRVLPGGSAIVDADGSSDPVGFQSRCVDDYWASCTVRGFSSVTIENDAGVLDRILALLGRPAWEATAEDVDRVVGGLAADGLAASTRRGYVQAFKGFHRFLQSRKAVEIDALFGVRWVARWMSSTRPDIGLSRPCYLQMVGRSSARSGISPNKRYSRSLIHGIHVTCLDPDGLAIYRSH